jgi:hypothetical protein
MIDSFARFIDNTPRITKFDGTTWFSPKTGELSTLSSYTPGSDMDLSNLFFYFDKSFLLTYFNNLLLVYFIYMFFKLILLSSIVELMWPTHFFNKKHNINYNKVKYRSFLEVFLKAIPTSPYLVTLNVALFKFFKF